jgi:hypothetical protein
MDEIDHHWFNKSARSLCPNLTHLEYEIIIDKLENASTRTLVSLDEARTLFASSTSSITNDLHIKIVYDFWHERRTTRVHYLSINLILQKKRNFFFQQISANVFFFFFSSFFLKIIRTND